MRTLPSGSPESTDRGDIPIDSNPLDNPVWSSLLGTQSALAYPPHANDRFARRYQQDVCPFGALADPLDPRCWSALEDLIGNSQIVLVVDPDKVPNGWKIERAIAAVQLDGSRVDGMEDPDLEVLTHADVAEMISLVERAQPGPFMHRTIEMGAYLGLRHDGNLVATSGERLRPAGWTEISAVCTDEPFRHKGIATRLIRAVAANIHRRGDKPFLHTGVSNEVAVRLYLSLGFTFRREVSFTFVAKQQG